MPPLPFHVTIDVPEEICGRIVTDRIACHRHTCTLGDVPKDVRTTVKARYQQQVVNVLSAACINTGSFSKEYSMELVKKFVALAHMLDSAKAVGFLFGVANEDEPVEGTAGKSLVASAYPALVNNTRQRGYSTSKFVDESFLHPLLIALLAFQLGGPVNAAFTTYDSEWRLPPATSSDVQAFYSEGDTGDFFDTFRITKVWENREGKITGPSGSHSVFLTGDNKPQSLVSIGAQTREGSSSPVTIFYDLRDAALYYDCQDPNAVRKSVSADFHLNTLTDDQIRLLVDPSSLTSPGELILSKLVTEFPILNYTARFHDLLFNSESLNAITTTLSTMTVPPRPILSNDYKELREKQFEAYKNDNMVHLPPEVGRMEEDICLKGSYCEPTSFFNNVVLKARRDIRLPIGMDLFPQTPIARNMEWARKFIRDKPEGTILTRLSDYAQTLVETGYSTKDLVTTPELRGLAKTCESHCLQLIAAGFVDDSSQLPSIAALVCALGEAIDGLKEVQSSAEPRIEHADLSIYRTRCLYLFWCVDWLACYVKKPVVGPFMIIDVEIAKASLQAIQGRVGQMAGVLLRNWVAWGLFLDTLPEGGFVVRLPSVQGRVY